MAQAFRKVSEQISALTGNEQSGNPDTSTDPQLASTTETGSTEEPAVVAPSVKSTISKSCKSHTGAVCQSHAGNTPPVEGGEHKKEGCCAAFMRKLKLKKDKCEECTGNRGGSVAAGEPVAAGTGTGSVNVGGTPVAGVGTSK